MTNEKTGYICSECEHILQLETRCLCLHPEGKEWHRIYQSGKGVRPGLIGWGRNGKFTVKTSPRWCPYRNKDGIIEITRKQAYRVISTGLPHGCFFVREGKIVTGLLNIGDEPEIEEFGKELTCKRWLLERKNNKENANNR